MSDHPNITRCDDQYNTEKSWGFEVWFANSPLYCGKLLGIGPGQSTSRHFHVKKTEHIVVYEGTLVLEITENAQTTQHILTRGDSILVTPGLVHKLCNKDSVPLDLIEFSTEHFDDDSYRIE